MLVLTRRSGEGIRIGDNIRVVILEVKGNQAKVGIEAPIDMQVYRDEVYERIKHENIKASSVATDHIHKFLKTWIKKKVR